MQKIAEDVPRERQSASDVWLLLACYSAIYVVMSVVMNTYVLTPAVMDPPPFEVEGSDVRDEWALRRLKWRRVGYVLTPLFVATKIGFTAVCLAVVLALHDIDVRFGDQFRIALVAEVVWVAAAAAHLTCVLYLVEIRTVADYASFYPLSALHFVDIGETDLWSVYLLKTLNVFEVGYMTALVAAARTYVALPLTKLIMLVMVGYGGGTILLVAAVTFAMIMFT